MIKLLIFDFDGTIADSADDICNSINLFLKRYNKPTYPIDYIKPYIGLGLTNLLNEVFKADKHFLDDKQMYNNFIECYQEHFLQSLDSFDGIHQLLDKWPHKVAIVSNKMEQFLVPAVKYLKLDHHPWVKIVGRDTLEEHKPHPLPLLTCCKEAGVSPEEALMVGDGLPDMHAAKAAGIKSVAVSFGYAPIEALTGAGADFTIDHFNELLPLIDKQL